MNERGCGSSHVGTPPLGGDRLATSPSSLKGAASHQSRPIVILALASPVSARREFRVVHLALKDSGTPLYSRSHVQSEQTEPGQRPWPFMYKEVKCHTARAQGTGSLQADDVV